MLQQLSYTCRSAFEVLGQHEAVVLRRENEAMRVELFNMTMPTFAVVVRNFNDARDGPQCTCSNCQHMGLIHNNWHDDWQGPCTLWPAWEDFLQRLQVSVDPQHDVDIGILVPWLDSHTLGPSCAELCAHIHLSHFFSDRIHDPHSSIAFDAHCWEDTVHSRSEAAVTKWRGRWTQHMQVVGAWGALARSMQDPRVAEWTRLLSAVRDLHFPARVAPTLGEFVTGGLGAAESRGGLD